LTPGDADLLLRAAAQAPSVHNTQPWLLSPGVDGLDLYADPSRRLRHGDPDGRSLLVSIGAAVLDVRVALAHLGLSAGAEIDPGLAGSLADHLVGGTDAPFPVARVRAAGRESPTDGTTPALARLFPAVWTRRTNRRPFRAEPVPAVLLEILAAAAAAEGARLRPVVEPSSVAAVVGLLRAAEAAEAADPALLGERAAHVGGPGRSSGIPVASLGPRADPEGPHGAAVRDLGVGVAAARESAAFETAPTLALLGTAGDEPADWVRAGQALQRLWLGVTTAGLHASLLNQPLEHPVLRPALLALAPGAGAAAQVLLRIGHGEPVPPTPRRPVSELRLRTG
jgi:nitroreductase